MMPSRVCGMIPVRPPINVLRAMISLGRRPFGANTPFSWTYVELNIIARCSPVALGRAFVREVRCASEKRMTFDPRALCATFVLGMPAPMERREARGMMHFDQCNLG